jgi:hypothetical protein
VVIGKGNSGFAVRAAALCPMRAARQTAIRAAYACEISMSHAAAIRAAAPNPERTAETQYQYRL